MSQWICGVDEAGRGPLVGSVVAAAVILDPSKPIEGLKDSKKLSEKQRNFLYDQIIKNAFTYHIACASHQEIDAINILQATMLAMKRAIEGVIKKLGANPPLTLIDGNRCPQLDIPMEAIVKGDAKVPEISAASILAKVTRDREMAELHERFPVYGFNQHMGYPTQAHMEALNQHGPCEYHRQTFGPVKKLLVRENL
jgi:ribonuclease HII